MATMFKPQKALDFDGALLLELQGDVSDKIVRDLLNDLPSLSPSSVVHDNGCGYGAVTRAIMASNPPEGIQIHATDVTRLFMDKLEEKMKENPSWPVTLETMDACTLTFPDNTFSLSFSTFIFSGLKDDVSAAAHILRTLKPGGTGVIAVWNNMPWHTALENAHRKFRGEGEPMAPFLSTSWYKGGKVRDVTKEAGWNPNDIEFVVKEAWINMGVDLRRWATIAWSFLAVPKGGWKQADEDNWDEAIDSIAKELLELDGSWHKVEDGVHKIRMVADVAIMRKQE
ncbi:S-adenosyl-L-methionine-dependent methyltransferase [Nemania abortiva]|nr:S-adenosyl-L-methionine-dependent methyltransferase [Nemania abortiva]